MPVARVALPLSELAEHLDAAIYGDATRLIHGVASLQQANLRDLAFLAQSHHRKSLRTTRAGGVLLLEEVRDDCPTTALVVANPYAAWARALQLLFPREAVTAGIHPSAAIDESAECALDARIEAQVVIGPGSWIGPRAWIEPGAVIGPHCTIGADTRIGPKVTLYAGTEIGQRGYIQAGAVLGGDGFGFAQEGGHHQKIPQLGRVVVEDDVEIGANSTIDRAALEETRIGSGSKIDNLVQIGHNCRIGEDCIVSGQAGLAGGVVLGDHCTLAGQAGVSGHLQIPPGSTITARTGVTSEIRAAGTYSGYPHQPHTEWRKSVAVFRRLHQLRYRIAALERALGEDAEGES